MELLLLILIPMAVFSGWWAAKKHSSKKAQFSLTSDYHKGINYLLNEKPDKALEVFLKLVEVDSETIETHITLGNLFRKRGEVEKAIRIHQNLIARPTLSQDERYMGMLELAKDYTTAGLLDRAENLLIDISKQDNYKKLALTLLREVYVQENEWDDAISISQMLAAAGESSQNKVIAHYYCEKAAVAMQSRGGEKAIELLQKAYQYDPYSIRASYMRGDIEYKLGNYQNAFNSFIRLVDLEIRFAVDILPKIDQCQEHLSSRRALKQLRELYQKLKAEGVYLSCFVEKVRDHEGVEEAKSYINHIMDRDLTLASYQDWLSLHPISVSSLEAKQHIKKLIKTSSSYQCGHCGYNSRKLQWQCPSCQNWGTIFPTQC